MTMYTQIPQPNAGDEWTRAQWVQYIVDNLNFLNSLLSGMIPGSTFAVNEVLIGDVGGAVTGLAVGNGRLVRGTQTAPEAFGPPQAGEVLHGILGVPEWAAPDVSVTLADIVKYT